MVHTLNAELAAGENEGALPVISLWNTAGKCTFHQSADSADFCKGNL